MPAPTLVSSAPDPDWQRLIEVTDDKTFERLAKNGYEPKFCEYLKNTGVEHVGPDGKIAGVHIQIKTGMRYVPCDIALSRMLNGEPPESLVPDVEPEKNEEPTNYCFDAGRNLYWIKNERGVWIALNETQFKRILRHQGVSPRVPQDSHVSPLYECLIEIQQTCDVHYAGALAGYSAGIYDMGERRILVTESPRIIEPRRGQFKTLRTFITGLLKDSEFDQIPYLYGWLKVAYETLRAGERRPGQGLVLAGVRDCGKSLLQNIITFILGGRSARPYQFMGGLTPFNSDLFEAEHLMIEDEQASTDIRARRNFGKG
jgi:hypothetical protein